MSVCKGHNDVPTTNVDGRIDWHKEPCRNEALTGTDRCSFHKETFDKSFVDALARVFKVQAVKSSNDKS